MNFNYIVNFNIKVDNYLPVPDGYVNIPSFNGYMINKHGSVIRIYCNNTKWKKLKGFINAYGYVKVGLRKNNKTYYISIHRLVAKLFIPNPNNYDIINHIDEDKTNNDYTNLEWCTVQYNNTYKNANNKYINKRKAVIVNDIKKNIITRYESLYSCSINMNINSGTIQDKIVKGTIYKHRYYFKYE